MSEKKTSTSKTVSNQHKAALDELANYKLLVESIQDYAIFLMDTEGYIQTWNKGAEKAKGYKPKEIIGKRFTSFYRQVDLDAKKPERELEIAIKFGRAEDEDWRVRKDGSLFWASVVITALFDSSGKHIGFAKVTRDLTERKKYEDELRFANRQLRQQQAELTRSSQSKDEFISIASHQLRTPASTIKQLLGLFTDGFIKGVDEEHLKTIQKAYECNERQITIVNDLLKVAQVDSGKFKLTLEKYNVAKLVEECVEEFKKDLKKKNQHISFTVKSKDNNIYVDESNLRMVFENILNNAIKYTYDNGTISVVVSDNENYLIISVVDNGVGIAEDDIGKLFTKFTRIPNDLSESEGGTGLGLYWAKSIIDLHGGSIEVISTLNEGSEFRISLPKST